MKRSSTHYGSGWARSQTAALFPEQRGLMIGSPRRTSRFESRVNSRILTNVNSGSLQRVYEVDPLEDPRWQSLVERHPQASIFHHVGWLHALNRTYGYEPVVFTASPPTSDLEHGMLFCRIRSWVTGNRIVSLPFGPLRSLRRTGRENAESDPSLACR